MELYDAYRLVPLVAACVLAWGIYHTNRRWEDQKQFERQREDQRAAAERRSLAASLLAEVTTLNELVTTSSIKERARAQLSQTDCAFHVTIRDREIMPIYVSRIPSLGMLGEKVNRLLSRHYTIVQAFLDENASIADAVTADQMGISYDREAMKQRVQDQIATLDVLLSNYDVLSRALRQSILEKNHIED